MEYCCASSSHSSVAVSLPHVYQFKISMFGAASSVWRQLQVPIGYGFFALHSAIQDAFEWTGYCPYRFEQLSRRPEIVSITLPLNGSEPSYEHDCLIKDYFISEGDCAVYVQHSLIPWTFQILLEKIFQAVEGVSYPKCVDGQQGCPPDQMGDDQYYCTDRNGPLQRGSLRYTEPFNPDAVVFRDPFERFHRPLDCDH